MRTAANGAGERINWNDVNWRHAYRSVRNLRQRIFRASQQGDQRKLASLQKLMLRSRANALVAVRQVTQINQGKRTPGIDKLVVRTSESRSRLVEQMLTYQPWRARPVKRILIPKRNGKSRPLGIPTVIDRAMQAVVKNALEPCWEALFEASSYGFRPGRSCHDAIARVFSIARPNKAKKWVLDADIEGAFDNIDHDFLLRTIGLAPGRALIHQWLKAGVLVDGVFQETPRGTPQGGVISPLLANIALHGMEVALGVKYTSRGTLKSKRALVRYADDFVIFCETKEDAQATRAEIEKWLEPRGLRLAEGKTRIVHLSEGFDFLGFTIRHYPMPRTTRSGWKLLITPSRDSVQQVRKRLRADWRKLVGQNAEAVIATLNPLIRGWANYFRVGVAKHTFSALDAYMVRRTLRWAVRTHPNKTWRWRRSRYWGLRRTGSQNRWIFGDKPTGKRLLMFHWFPIERHVLVRGRASPDDASLREYWAGRERGRSHELSALKQQLADAQRATCPQCGQTLHSSEALHVHHIVPRRRGGTNAISNLQLVHQQCHEQIHALMRRHGMRGGLPEPCAGKPARTVPRGERSHPSLLPYDGYDTGKLRYPVMYLLHGNGGDENEP